MCLPVDVFRARNLSVICSPAVFQAGFLVSLAAVNEDPGSLAERATSGDSGALEGLLVRNLEALRMFVRLKAGPQIRAKESCSDIVGSVCREVLADASGFEYQGETAFRNWLFTKTLHKIINRARHHNTKKRDVGLEVGGTVGEVAALEYATIVTPSRVASARERAEQVEAAFDQLPEEQRDAVVYKRVVGMSYEEIAKEMGKSYGAVRNLVHRGVAKLTLLVD